MPWGLWHGGWWGIVCFWSYLRPLGKITKEMTSRVPVTSKMILLVGVPNVERETYTWLWRVPWRMNSNGNVIIAGSRKGDLYILTLGSNAHICHSRKSWWRHICCIAKCTMVDWCNFCRDIRRFTVVYKECDVIGGPKNVIKIDESSLGRQNTIGAAMLKASEY